MRPVLSVIEIGTYSYHRMMVEMAANNGAQAVRSSCSDYATPMTQNCAGLSATLTTAVQTTPLGANVSVVSGFPTEGYYCVNGSDGLVLEPGSTLGTVGTPPIKASPFDCTAVGGNTSSPGAYMRVSVTYTYTALFSGISITGVLASPIVRTAWVRVS